MKGDRQRNPFDRETTNARRGEAGRRSRAGPRRRPVLGSQHPALTGAQKNPLDLGWRRRFGGLHRIVDRRQGLLVQRGSTAEVPRVMSGVAEQCQHRPGPPEFKAALQQDALGIEVCTRRQPLLRDPRMQQRHGPAGPAAENVIAGGLPPDGIVEPPGAIEIARRKRRAQLLGGLRAVRPCRPGQSPAYRSREDSRHQRVANHRQLDRRHFRGVHRHFHRRPSPAGRPACRTVRGPVRRGGG